MKEVMAIIRMNKMNQTKKALADAGLPAFVALECLGRGRGLINQEVLKGAAEGNEEAIALLGTKGRLYPKRIVTVVVPDADVQKVVDTIIGVNKSGRAGDGKIMVMPIGDSVRVRTGEAGEAAVS
ncbi:P-II family nitrogen regulator [Desulfovibrio sulfodismutans]|uniref:P-II family nitrogen regulator n=1 Tax=Desulfolutivibrio sulfodismutans TaxID=63561 RepID=A0A7K3NN57_9BACT|nr:P-II family nitrogen regulator [Desulfolutivibrio sulfodismutans]NDY57557.1 P-II family nitrogen regulator [Desulfolutivibrio sulfodismutans]QLA14282.1 P-II family nitrogen regulator [Desulfolutivibrio sulfodismutans DSM 3696]